MAEWAQLDRLLVRRRIVCTHSYTLLLNNVYKITYRLLPIDAVFKMSKTARGDLRFTFYAV